MKYLVTILFLACDFSSACEEEVMQLREKSIGNMSSMLVSHLLEHEKEWGGIVYVGSCHNWHQFRYNNWFETDGQIGGGHVIFRCKDLKLVSIVDGEEVREGSIIRVVDVDLDSRTVLLDSPDFKKIIEDTQEELEHEAEQGSGGNEG